MPVEEKGVWAMVNFYYLDLTFLKVSLFVVAMRDTKIKMKSTHTYFAPTTEHGVFD
jgi:hypothetical protein